MNKGSVACHNRCPLLLPASLSGLLLAQPGSLVEVCTVIVDVCWSLPAEGLLLSPVVVLDVEPPELTLEVSQGGECDPRDTTAPSTGTL